MIYTCDSQLDGKNAQTTHVAEFLHNIKFYLDVTCFAPKPYNGYKIDDVTYINVFNKRISSSILFQISLFFSICFYILNNGKPDVIYSRHSVYTISPLIISKVFSIPYIVEVNGLKVDESIVLGFSSKIYLYLTYLSEKINYESADLIITVTDHIRQEISERYDILKDNVFVLSNGVNTDLFKPMDQDESRKILKLDLQKKYICFVGTLAQWQGVEHLILAAPNVIKEFHNVCFLIVGDGVMKDELIQLTKSLGVAENFIIVGSVPYESVPLYINSSDICVSLKKPLKSGYSPLKLYEYMACSKPIIATETSGFEILKEFNAGLLVDPNDSVLVAKTICMLIKDKDICMLMGSNGYRYVVKNNSWRSIAERTFKLCNQLIPSK